MADALTNPAATRRFGRKREAIIAAATEIINRRGVKGMTLAGVAERVGLITTSVTYYFKKKEALAAACFDVGIERLAELVRLAGQAPSPSDRLLRLIGLYLELRARITAGEEPPIPVFSDIRALSPPFQGPVVAAYAGLFRAIRALFWTLGMEWLDAPSATARTQMVLEQLHWSQAWLHRYDVQDYPRVRDRMHDILVRGMALPQANWSPAPLTPAQPGGADLARETFLLAATRLINHRGYRGASVEKISAALNVTKGAFYHHHNAKDDVVIACFERAFAVVRGVQNAALDLPGDGWGRLSAAAAALVEFQFSAHGPLLRTSALSALPEAIREQMVAQSDRLSARFAAMISDAIAEGSVRPVDALIAAQMMGATLNAAADLPAILQGMDGADAVEVYARPMLMGVLSR